MRRSAILIRRSTDKCDDGAASVLAINLLTLLLGVIVLGCIYQWIPWEPVDRQSTRQEYKCNPTL